VERIERGLVAHGWAGRPSAGRRRALQRYRGSKTHAAFRPALRREGRARKAVPGAARNASGNEHVARGCQLSLLSVINAGHTGTNRPHQAEISTAGRYTFAGRVINPDYSLADWVKNRGTLIRGADNLRRRTEYHVYHDVNFNFVEQPAINQLQPHGRKRWRFRSSSPTRASGGCGLSPWKYPTDRLVSAGKEGRHETGAVQ
jgi:hypothetical protein